MSYCCVPLCKSDEKKKTPGLSFHEIPSAADVREKWLAVIRRDNWSPNSTSCYTKVCNRHFGVEDFVEGKRRRFLKKGVVPSVFEDYPAHLQPKLSAERSRASILKQACVPLKQKSDYATSAAASVVLPPAVQTPRNHELEEPEPMDITDAFSDTNQRSNFPPETPPACDRGVQVDSRRAVASLLATEKAKWKRKEKDLRNQVSRLQRTVDKYKLELEKLQQDSMVADISYIKERAVEQQPAALFLLDQIINFRRKRPTWSEETTRRCVVLRHLSTKAYEHMRGEALLKLPSRTTLSNYIGTTSGETGFSKLVETRLAAEARDLKMPQSGVCSLIVDEMQIKEKLQYHKQRDYFVGQVDTELGQKDTSPVLANSLLCFVISGLTTPFRIPVVYYFMKGLTGDELYKRIIFVMKKLEACGFVRATGLYELHQGFIRATQKV
ncbi:hypothetical protein HPB51_015606 [Rhipicephalus microplus]|uniref:THAP-type domain-containing protein n=1 Tax=Rhipicephalus microplus TaxID=6941 RepID=A0A9J6DHD6_RHIMP|nr:hypothetical protein HPB51_015606 [Rhipicephalus microplus]